MPLSASLPKEQRYSDDSSTHWSIRIKNKLSEILRSLPLINRRASLHVYAADILAPLEIADNTGKMIQIGMGQITSSDLEPGFYRVRLSIPEGDFEEELIELLPRGRKLVNCAAPKQEYVSTFNNLIASAGFHIDPTNNSLVKSDELDPIMSARLSTILLLAGGTAGFPTNRYHIAKALGLNILQDPSSSSNMSSNLLALFGSEFEKDREFMSNIGLMFVSQDLSYLGTYKESKVFDNLALSTSIPGIAAHRHTVTSNRFGSSPHFWLWLYYPDHSPQCPIVFNLSIPPERRAILVFHREVDNTVRVFQYLPKISSSEINDDEMKKDLDNLRRLELMQRFYLNGRLHYAYAIARHPFDYYEEIDPIGTLLAFYIARKLGRLSEVHSDVLFKAADALHNLSDSHILRAEYQRISGEHKDAQESFRKALDTGLPIFFDGLMLLFQRLTMYENNIQNERWDLLKEVYRKRIRGMIWSAWTPNGSHYTETEMEESISSPSYSGQIHEDNYNVYINDIVLPKR